jgi:opacity protein-like surface antigen
MALNRLAILAVSVLVLAGYGFAQPNEISGTVGRTFVSTQTIQGAQFFNPNVHFGDGLAFALNYSHLFKRRGIFGFSLEVPLAVAPDTDLNSGTNLVPQSYKAFFITPSARVNFFSGAGVSPWVSAGGGYGLFKESGHALYYGPNTGSTRTNTGVVQFGTGLDVWPWHKWGLRLEARDFYSGMPQLNVNTGRSRQHNYYVGGGFIRRF